jgi:hypothetical protein
LAEKTPTVKHLDSIWKRFARFGETGQATTYYHPRLQNSSFDLPYWAEKEIYGHAVTGVAALGK